MAFDADLRVAVDAGGDTAQCDVMTDSTPTFLKGLDLGGKDQGEIKVLLENGSVDFDSFWRVSCRHHEE